MSGKLYIGGHWEEGEGDAFSSVNPATGESLWSGRAASIQQTRNALQVARDAFPAWSGMPLGERIAIIRRYQVAVEQNATAFAEIIAKETGKTLWDAKGEVQATIGKVGISIDAYAMRTGEKQTESAHLRSYLHYKPHGVAAVYGPYNFPAHLPNGHIVPALIAGNTIVFKPSDYTPLVAETMVKYWEQAGLPEGVINLVQGGREVGVALAAGKIDALYFTGSAEVGALLHQQFGGRPEIMLALEMGGNNPLIVHKVANIHAAAVTIAQSAFISTGQRCTCARRLIIPSGKEGDAVIDALISVASGLLIGAYNETPEPFMGPLISAAEARKLLQAQEKLLSQGAQARLRMEARADNPAFVSPAILDVSNISAREDREYFGPFLQVIRVPDFNAALKEANNTRYGLSAGLISDDLACYDVFLREIRAGVIAFNRPTTGASSALPFGGIGISGNHRPSAYLAADYCAYPVAAQVSESLQLGVLPPGMNI